jgi:hypothetical protein
MSAGDSASHHMATTMLICCNGYLMDQEMQVYLKPNPIILGLRAFQPPSRPHTSHPMRRLFVATCFCLLGGWSTGSAQVAPGAVPIQQPQQVPAVISPVPPMGAPQTSGLPAKITTPTTTNRLAPNAQLRSSATRSSIVKRGLPGIQGGAPLNSPSGARDPSSGFMRPPTIGPLFCDPAEEIFC